MKSINKSLLLAAVLSTALPVLAQNPGGQNPGTGSTSPDPSNETNTTNPSGARNTGVNPNPNSNPNAGAPGGPNTVQDANTQPDASTDDMNQPKPKRSFWDRLFGRNKHLDSDKTSTENDASGRKIESQP